MAKLETDFYAFMIFINLSFISLLVFQNHLVNNSSPTNLEQPKLISYNYQKYIMYECGKICGGWADRLKGIMTTYALSLLTNRTFLIKMNKPCQLEKYLQPNEINWSAKISRNKLTTRKLFIYWNWNYVREKFLKTNFLNYNKDKELIVVRTGFNLVKYLTYNKKHHKRIRDLGYDVAEFNLEYQFNKWYKKLFKFNSDLEALKSNLVKQAKPTNRTKLVCAQIRLGSGGIDLEFASRNSSKSFWKFIHSNFISKLNTNDYKLFITTDTASVYKESVKEFGKEKIVSLSEKTFHFEFDTYKNRTYECDWLSRVFVDFNFLSLCDMGVVSHSGFGMCGIINREDKNFSNFYVYTNPNLIKKSFFQRKNLSFYKFDTSLLYLEFKI